ncbi:hypothetical protein LC593_02600 [Nostoc sp. CHAB 5844]|nr:hypothetical protein [Nostoc sp. CHAB 5844]
MTVAKYQAMSLNQLRRYVLTHREDIEAFHVYIDRSKSEGRMVSLDMSDENWEEQVKKVIKKAIKNSSTAIRWYCDKTVENSIEVQTITQWWSQLDSKNATIYHITGIEIDKEIGIWEPTQLNSPVKLTIIEPSLEIGQFTTLVKYKDKNRVPNQIEAVAIDLDTEKENLFIWPTTSAEVFIFAKETI